MTFHDLLRQVSMLDAEFLDWLSVTVAEAVDYIPRDEQV